MRVTPNKVIEALLERVTPNSPNQENSSSPTQEKISPNREWGNPVEVATKVGKSCLVECGDGS